MHKGKALFSRDSFPLLRIIKTAFHSYMRGRNNRAARKKSGSGNPDEALIRVNASCKRAAVWLLCFHTFFTFSFKNNAI